MTLCERVFEDLKAYLDGELGWGASWTVRRHLAACPGCRQELEEMTALQTRLRNADAVELPPALRARILAACADVEPLPARTKASSRFLARPRLAWGTIAVVFLLTVAVLSGPTPTWWRAADEAPAAKAAGGVPAAPGPMPQKDEDAGTSRMNRKLARTDQNGLAETPAAAPSSAARPQPSSDRHSAIASKTKGQGLIASTQRMAEPARNLPAASLPREVEFGRQARSASPPSDGGSLGKAILPASPQLSYDAPAGPAGPAGSTLLAEKKPAVELVLMVDNVAASSANIKAAAKSLGGEVAPTSLGLVASNVENLTIDVPVDKLKETVAEIKKQGDVISKVLPEAEHLSTSRQFTPGEQAPTQSAGAGARALMQRDDRKEKSLQAADAASSSTRRITAGSENAAAKRSNSLSEPKGAGGAASEYRANKPSGDREQVKPQNNNPPAQNGAARSGGQGASGGAAGAGGFGAGFGGGGLGGGVGGAGSGGGRAGQANQQDPQGGATRNPTPAQPARGKKDERGRFQDGAENNVKLGSKSQPQNVGRANFGQNRDLSQTPALRQTEQLKSQFDKQSQAHYYNLAQVNRDRSKQQDAYARITIRLRQKQNPAPAAEKKP